jgi:hypothetical protein
LEKNVSAAFRNDSRLEPSEPSTRCGNDGGRLEKGRAVIRLSHEQAFYGTYGCGLLRIDLRDGTFSERWRDLESAGAGMEPCWAELEKDAAPARP